MKKLLSLFNTLFFIVFMISCDSANTVAEDSILKNTLPEPIENYRFSKPVDATKTAFDELSALDQLTMIHTAQVKLMDLIHESTNIKDVETSLDNLFEEISLLPDYLRQQITSLYMSRAIMDGKFGEINSNLEELESYIINLASSGSPEIGTIWKAIHLFAGSIEESDLRQIAIDVIKHNHKRYNEEAGCFNCEMEDWLSLYDESYQLKMNRKKSEYFQYFTEIVSFAK